jgi:hypothetical protein
VRETVKVVQEFMRHADPRITLDLYGQVDEEAKRTAQRRVSGLLLENMAS